MAPGRAVRPLDALRRLQRPHGLGGYVAGLAAVAAMTGAIVVLGLRAHLANVSMLYLIAVIATAVVFGLRPAVVAAFASFLAFDFLFVEPLYTLRVADPDEWVALLVFLLTAIVTGQLTAALRNRALDAEEREREAIVLYDIARISAEPDLASAARNVAERLRGELGLEAIAVELREDARAKPIRGTAGESAWGLLDQAGSLPARVLGEGQLPTGARRGAPGRWLRIHPPYRRATGTAPSDALRVVPIVSGGQRLGTIVFAPSERTRASVVTNRLLGAVAAHLGLAVERARLRREVTDAEVLRRTDDLRSALVRAVSHDLRTPLASIIASAGALRQEGAASGEAAELLGSIEDEARRLDRIVANLLDLSRIEAGAVRPELGWYDIGALVDDVLGRLHALTQGRRVEVDVADDLPPVRIDYVEIDQVLTNLVDNAARHTPPGVEIRVAARKLPDAVELEVADRGPGLPATDLARVFEPYYRGSDRDGRARGDGLGLAIARGLVAAHGGTISAENRPDGGTRFLVRLPLQ